MKMRYLIIFLLLFSALEAKPNSDDEAELKSLIETPLTFSKELPVDLSQSNRKNHLKNPQVLHKETEQNIAFIKSKSLPWLPFASVLATALVILYVRMLPPKETKEIIDPLAKEKALVEIKTNLQKLATRHPKDDIEAKTSIMQLNTLLRMYLINQYGLPAFSYTSQELEEKLGKVEIDQGFRETMLRVFYEADHVKYAKEKITPEEFVAIARLLKNVD